MLDQTCGHPIACDSHPTPNPLYNHGKSKTAPERLRTETNVYYSYIQKDILINLYGDSPN